jgi:uncharacterized protein YkwD
MKTKRLRQEAEEEAESRGLSRLAWWLWWGMLLLLLSSLALASLVGEAAVPFDPCSGLVKNGCFNKELDYWEEGGELSVSITEIASTCDTPPVVLLGTPVPAEEHPKGSAWISQTITIPLQIQFPVLTFCYDIFTNDIFDWSSFHVRLRKDSENDIEILRDGYESEGGSPPKPGTELGWRTFVYDLTPYRGHTITLEFENKNEHDGGWGIWTYVDGIKIRDRQIYLPAVIRDPTPTPTPTSTPTPTPTPSPTSTPDPKQIPTATPTPTPTPGPEDQLVELINQERARQGPPALSTDERLMEAARRHSEDMATNDLFQHIGSDGSTPQDRMQAAGYPVGRGHEILAAHPAGDPAVVLKGWMEHEYQRGILMDPEFVHIGAGYAYNSEAEHDHYWTVNVAQPLIDTETHRRALVSTSTTTPIPTPDPSDLEHQLVALINQERAKESLPPLIMDERLMEAARGHSEDMATNDFLSHTGSDGSNPIYRMRKADYPLAGDEVLSIVSGEPADVLADWMAIQAESDILTDPAFVHIGVGYVYTNTATHEHYWTVKVGHPPIGRPGAPSQTEP